MKQARKKKKAILWYDGAILLLRPESSGFRFLVQIRAFDLAGITKLKNKQTNKQQQKKTWTENTKRILVVVVK